MGVRGLDVDEATSRRLARIRQHDTKPEQIARSMLRALGLRYRIKNRDLPGSPDAANRSQHWAVFVHGCFWHAHRGCPRATVPKRNHEFWAAKFAANRARDARAVAELRAAGFRVVVLWECELEEQPAKAAKRLATTLMSKAATTPVRI